MVNRPALVRTLVNVTVVCIIASWVSVAHAREVDLNGTRKGPTGSYVTMAEREALRERVQKEPWAREYFEKEILPATKRGDRWACAVAYLVTGEKRYLKEARDALVYRINQWHSVGYAGGNFAWCMVGGDFHEVYDLIADALTPEDELACRRYMKDELEAARAWHKKNSSNTNMRFCAFPSMLRWACAIGDDEYVEWLFNHGAPGWWPSGLKFMLDEYLRDGKIGIESPVYHTISVPGIITVAEVLARYRGDDFYSNYRTKSGARIRNFLDGLIETAYPLERTGIGKGSPRVANWGHASTDWGISSGDVFLVNSPGGGSYSPHKCVRRLLRRYPKAPGYRWLMSLVPEAQQPDRDDFLYGRLKIPAEAPAPAMPSVLFPQSGIAVLRSPEGPDYWRRGTAAFIHGGEQSRGHLADPMLMLHGAGRLLYPEWCATQYEMPGAIGWTMRRLSANTMVIDGKDGLYSYTTYRHGYHPEVKFVSMRCHPYLEALMERSLMLTEEYLLDAFWARVFPEAFAEEHFPGVGGSVYWECNASLSEDVIVHLGQERNFYGTTREKVFGPRKMPQSHTFDYMLHGLGRQFPESKATYEPSQEFTTSYWPNRWAQNERKMETGESFFVDWLQTSGGIRLRYPKWTGYPPWRDLWRRMGNEWFKGRAGVRMRMLGDDGTTVYLGNGPMRWGPVDKDLYPEEVIPFVAVRRKGKEALFVALHEPYKINPSITHFDYIHKPDPGKAAPNVGVRVTGPGFTDSLFVTLNVGGQRFDKEKLALGQANQAPVVSVSNNVDDTSEVVRFSNYAYLRVTKDGVRARGDIKGFVIRAPEAPAKGHLTLNGNPLTYNKKGDYVLYKMEMPKGKKLQLPVAKKALPQAFISLPRKFVNIDVKGGGVLLVRVTGDSARRKVEGRVVVKPGQGLRVEAPEKPFTALGKNESKDLAFDLKARDAALEGRLVPLDIELYVKERLTYALKTTVAVGVVAEEIEEQYNDRPQRNKVVTDVYDRFLVRAPGYTIQIDKQSGASRWIADPDGKVRTSLGWYPYVKARGRISMADMNASLELPTVWSRDKKKIFGWDVKAQSEGLSVNEATGEASLSFASADGTHRLNYVFHPDVVEVSVEKPEGGYARLDLSKLDIEDAGYRYRLLKQGNKFGFKIGEPYVVPKPLPKSGRAEGPVELNINGDFSQMEPNQKHPSGEFPAGWEIVYNSFDVAHIDEKNFVTGGRSLRFDLSKMRETKTWKANCWLRRRGIPVKAFHRYRLTLRIRHEAVRELVPHQILYVQFKGPGKIQGMTGGKWPHGYNPAWWPKGTRDWVELRYEGGRRLIGHKSAPITQDGELTIALMLPGWPNQEGTIWLDEIILDELGPAQ